MGLTSYTVVIIYSSTISNKYLDDIAYSETWGDMVSVGCVKDGQPLISTVTLQENLYISPTLYIPIHNHGPQTYYTHISLYIW